MTYLDIHPAMKKSRHYKLAQTVLGKAEAFLRSRGWKIIGDRWPFHIVVVTSKGKYISIYCSGFDHYLDLQPLTKKGSSDKRYEEKRFGGVKGLANYLNKHFA